MMTDITLPLPLAIVVVYLAFISAFLLGSWWAAAPRDHTDRATDRATDRRRAAR